MLIHRFLCTPISAGRATFPCLQVYNADPSIKVGKTRFCCIYMGHTFAKQEGPPVFTMERDGCEPILFLCNFLAFATSP